jgi:ABC-type nickel/cobalt efflux system permease component RcnA
MRRRLFGLLALGAAVAAAHPMGNFSVNHYARIEPAAHGAKIRYVLDLAEIPTFELFQQWGAARDKAMDQARQWAASLAITVDGKPVAARVEKAELFLADGAASMQVARIVADLRVDAAPGALVYEDRNYNGRSGWKEIVIQAGDGINLTSASAKPADRSAELTAYPQDPMLAPPQDLKASLSWTATPVSVPAPVPTPVSRRTEPATTRQAPHALSSPPAGVAPAATAPVPASVAPAAGTVVRGDYLSQLLHRTEIGWGLTLIGIAVAFGLGAMHALSPGHGKTIVAAYLVGSRGTYKHAIFLGAMVTFTHTASVFLLGFVTLFLSKYVLPETLFPILGAISGLSIVWVGAALFFRRLRGARSHLNHHHDHDHHHDHGHADGHTHDHGDGRAHSHVPEGEVTLSSLIALGASGGLVPCPSALVLLLSAISLGRTPLGMLLLVGFSAGLAVVLMGMGVLVLCVGNLLPASRKVTGSKAFRLLPVASAALITCIGLVVTAVSLGIIRPLPVG